MEYRFTPQGVCSTQIIVEVEDGIIRRLTVENGCHGNLQGISKLVEGMKVDEVIKRLEGIDCRGRGTSCPDQIAKALRKLNVEEKQKMNIELATKNDIPNIIEILKQRCEWLEQNGIEQWGEWYYTKMYNEEYFVKKMETDKLYVAKLKDEVIGCFLLKTEDQDYWKNNEKAYYIHHLATKLGYPNLGTIMLKFIESLAKQDSVNSLRLDCMKSNTKLNEYYKRQGFKNRGEGEEPYPHKLWEKSI